jgi:hypothetical protein
VLFSLLLLLGFHGFSQLLGEQEERGDKKRAAAQPLSLFLSRVIGRVKFNLGFSHYFV